MDKRKRIEIARLCVLMIGAIFGGMLNVPGMVAPAILGIILGISAYTLLWDGY